MVMPRASTEWAGAAALWITAAGWAGAAERRFGSAWVVTPDAIASAAQCLEYTRRQTEPTEVASDRGRLEVLARTGLKDVRELLRGRRTTHIAAGPWDDADVALVWQHHDLFHTAGVRLARSLDVPLVSFVHAPQVWEAARWGVRRPGWGHLVERFGESPQLRASDLVACVSDEVAAEMGRFGVPDERLVVTPMAVDPDRFAPDVSGGAVRREFDLGDDLVFGWTGSFRGFHGLDQALRAYAEVRGELRASRMLLVGEGAQRRPLARLADDLGIGDRVVFTGGVSNERVPELVAAMDVTLVTARPGDQFHYSPLKMREYMASAKVVIAPDLGEVPQFVEHDVSGLLYDPETTGALATQLVRASDDVRQRVAMGRRARAVILERGTWDVQLERVLDSPVLARVHG
jgi:glycosyltransferase involved in cell wall biosynthesis